VRILLIEDEPIVQFYLQTQLSQINGEVIATNFAAEALSLLEKDQNFDLILTDIKMPGIDGFELIDILIERGINIPVVIESAYDYEEKSKEYENKIKGFIKKPIDLNILEAVINQIKG